MKRRRVIQLVLLLLAGAIVNVAVAWGCAAFTHPFPQVGSGRNFLAYELCSLLHNNYVEHDASNDEIYLLRTIYAATEFDAWVDGKQLSLGHSKDFGLTVEMLHATRLPDPPGQVTLGGPSRTVFAAVISAGFPCRAMHGEQWLNRKVGSPNIHRSAVSIDALLSKLTSSHSEGRFLPLAVIWPGFAINTIFYAAILWVVFFAPGMVKRVVRRRRGLCPACAYPIGSSEVCTECGMAVQPRRGDRV